MSVGVAIERANGTTVQGEALVNDLARLNEQTRDETATFDVFGDAGVLNLLDLAPRAGGFQTQRLFDGSVVYEERIPASSVDSLVVGVRPEADLRAESISGVWGLVESVSDTRRRILNRRTVEVSVRVLAGYEAFADHTAVATELEV